MRIHAFTDDVLGNRDATSIAQAIKNKDISIHEVVEATINRIEKVNPALNAMVIKTYDEALHAKGANVKGFFYGVPTLIKDNCDLKGYPTQHGTGVFKAKPAKKNSAFVDQLLSTGLSYIGKSTMPELGLICSTENERWGITRNPWNTDYTYWDLHRDQPAW
ncbi:MAG: amidase family protein [Chitinophagales bacterium]|nr:amidase family protein [Chitinophagales bacterium]